MMSKRVFYFLCLIPFFISCQKYNTSPYDDKERILRQFPIEESKTMVLDSLWDKRDSLTYLRLKNIEVFAMNEVTYIPNWIGELKNIKIFMVVNEKNKRIKSIPSSIGELFNLTEFKINNNEVTSLPNSFYNLKKMDYLKLGNNKIKKISPLIGNLENIISLSLAGNPLESLPSEICYLKKIEFLDLDHTKIRELPKCIGEFQNLEWIHISGTLITEFPVEILNAPNLNSIQANGLKLKNYEEIKAICKKRNIRLTYDE